MDPSSSNFSSRLSLQQQAINAALNCLWGKAFKINHQILKSEPNNVDALSRLGRVCFELGKLEQAKKYYNQALKTDPYNPIALKNLKIIKATKPNGEKKASHINPISPNMFLHEPGKTKVVTLIKVAEPQKLSNLYPGMAVCLVNKSRVICVTDLGNQYLGILPDDIAFLLTKFIRGGNKYDVIIKSVRVNGLSVLIRESFRAAKFKNRPSFLEATIKFQASASPALPAESIEEAEEE